MKKFNFTHSQYTPHFASAGLFMLTLILNLNITFSADNWKELADPFDYLSQSKMSLLDKEFYFPHKTEHFFPRPFTVPLFYKLCGSNTDIIVQMQRVVLSLSAFFMVAAFMLLLRKTSSKYVLMLAVYMLVSWWNVQGWARLVLSESLSTSLFFCWLASLLFLYHKKSKLRWWLLHAGITVLLAFSRDSWPYVLMVFYAGMCLLWLVFKQPGVKSYVALLAFSVVIFGLQQHAAKVGERHKLPVINSIVVRILNNPAYTAWFVQNGMPCAEKLQQNYSNLDVAEKDGEQKVWALYNDTAYQPFLNWVTEKGQTVYTRFLITHPAFVLGADETQAQLSRIMSYNLFYIDDALNYTIIFDFIFPLFNVAAIIVLCLGLLVIFARNKNPVLLAPVLLALFTLLNAILSYNADSLEVERHLYITNVLVQLTGLWAVAMIWDGLTWQVKTNTG